MQNIAFRVPAKRDHFYRIGPTGPMVDASESSSSRFIFRTQSGYTGKMPANPKRTPHAYNFNFQDIKAEQAFTEYKYTNGGYEYAQGPILNVAMGGCTIFPDTSSIVAGLYNRALDDLNTGSGVNIGSEGTQGARGGMDVSIDLAEYHQVQKMLNVKDQILNFSKTFVGRFGPLKAASGLWLQYVYGVKPLLSTLHDSAEELVRTTLNKSESFSGRASTWIKPTAIEFYTIFGPQQYPVVDGKVKLSVTLGMDLRTQSGVDLARWSSLNPASIAWELLPYSFVVDWFVNVGGYLRDTETAIAYGSRFNSGYRTDLAVSSGLKCRADFQGSDSQASWKGAMLGSLTFKNISRSLLTQYPRPNLPRLGANLGSSRLMSAASLLANVLEGRKTLRDRNGRVIGRD